MHDPNTVAGIISALCEVHRDDIARATLNDGVSLTALIDALLRSSAKNRDVVKLITGALCSGDFITTPNFGSAWHIKYLYDRPRSLRVVDVAIVTLDQGTLTSGDVRLRLASTTGARGAGIDPVASGK